MQAQIRQIRIQAPQPWNKPARQQTARTAEDKRRIRAALGQFPAHIPQALERLEAGIAQPHAGICEFNAASILDEKTHPKVFFQHFQLSADGTVGHMQLLGSLTDAVEAGSGFERTQGVKGWKVSAHL